MHAGLLTRAGQVAVAALMWALVTAAPLATARAAAAPATPAAAAPAASTGSELEQAQKLYDSAKFAEAIDGLRAALASGQITGNDVVAARALMARCLVKTGNRLDAKQAFSTVLRMDPAYRPDEVVVPPDEMDVFRLALAAVTAEQIEAGKRLPASLAFFFGTGSGKNEDMAEVPHSQGGKDQFDSKGEFGGAVRFPLRPRLSLELEIKRLRATAADSGSASYTQINYEASAIPLVVNVFYTIVSGSKLRVGVFAGGGPLAAANMNFTLYQRFSPLVFTVGDERVGTFMQGGAEGEFLLHPRFSVNGRLAMRSASAKDFFKEFNVDLYGNNVTVQNRKMDFGGFAAYIGLRAYIGY